MKRLCIIDWYHVWKYALKEGKFVSGLFLDFSKAYATINHDILFNKLYGIKGKGLSFVMGYLTNRYQYNEYDNENSSKSKILFRGGGGGGGSLKVQYLDACSSWFT